MKEVWRDLYDYENYQVSNLGNIRNKKFNRILKGGVYKDGYKVVCLSKNNKSKTFNVHQLVAISFLDHKPNGYELVVDHINGNKRDNRLDNLRLITHRDNVTNTKKTTSKYTGVSWVQRDRKWVSSIYLSGFRKHLGNFKSEIRASIAYELALLQKDKLKELYGI